MSGQARQTRRAGGAGRLACGPDPTLTGPGLPGRRPPQAEASHLAARTLLPGTRAALARARIPLAVARGPLPGVRAALARARAALARARDFPPERRREGRRRLAVPARHRIPCLPRLTGRRLPGHSGGLAGPGRPGVRAPLLSGSGDEVSLPGGRTGSLPRRIRRDRTRIVLAVPGRRRWRSASGRRRRGRFRLLPRSRPRESHSRPRDCRAEIGQPTEAGPCPAKGPSPSSRSSSEPGPSGPVGLSRPLPGPGDRS